MAEPYSDEEIEAIRSHPLCVYDKAGEVVVVPTEARWLATVDALRERLRGVEHGGRERDVQGSDAWHMVNLLRAVLRCEDMDEVNYNKPKIQHRLDSAETSSSGIECEA